MRGVSSHGYEEDSLSCVTRVSETSREERLNIYPICIYSKTMRFEWDEDKALENAKKHRVSFEQAQQVFDDPRAVPFEDLEHSTAEEARYVMMGMS